MSENHDTAETPGDSRSSHRLLTAADVRSLELPVTRRGDIRADAVERLREQVCETLASLYNQLDETVKDRDELASRLRDELSTLEQEKNDAREEAAANAGRLVAVERQLAEQQTVSERLTAELASTRDTLHETSAKLVAVRDELDTERSRSSNAEAVELLAMAQKTAAELIAKAEADAAERTAAAQAELERLDEERRQAVADADAVARDLAAADEAAREAMRAIAADLVAVADSCSSSTTDEADRDVHPHGEHADGHTDDQNDHSDNPDESGGDPSDARELVYSDSSNGKIW